MAKAAASRLPEFGGWFDPVGGVAPWRWGVGVSGGGDSMALLHMLVKAGYGERIVVCHYNHTWSAWGDEAEAFVRAFCAKHKLKLVVGKGRGRPKSNAEEKAREERLAFFGKVAAAEGLDGIITGHTASDQVEGFLMRLMRGSGLKGLTGMAFMTTLTVAGAPMRLWRPLLYPPGLTRAEARAYLRANKAAWMDDPSNGGDDTVRARIRRLWPEMEKAGFSEEAIRASMCNLGEADGMISKMATEAWTACVTGGKDCYRIDRRAMLTQPQEVAQRIVARAITGLTDADLAPRLSKRLDLLDKIAVGKRGKATLGGVLWSWDGQTVVARKERA